MTGYFSSGGISFSDDISFNNTQSNNTADGFLAKYDASGTVLWARQIGGIGSQNGKAVAVASGNGVILGIECSGTSQIDGETFELTELGILVVRFENDGSLAWGTTMSTSGQVSIASIATGSDGSIAICGSFNDADLNTAVGTLTNNGNYDVYVAKLNSDGDPLWARSAGASMDDDARGVAIDSDGNVIVAGHYTSAGMTIAGVQLTNANDNYNDMFLAKYAPDGSGLWAFGQGGILHERAWDIALDADDNIIICGGFIDATFDLAGTELVNTTSDDSWYDLFVAKFDPSGSLDWAISDGGTYDEFVRSVAVGTDGAIHVGGYFDSNDAQFGSDVLEAAGSGYDAFVAKYSADGTAIWGKAAGSGSGDHGESIAMDAGGGILLTGYFGAETEIDGIVLEHASDNDVWLLKLGGTTHVDETDRETQVDIWPNPATSAVRVAADRMDEIVVVDVHGRSILTITPKDQLTELDLPGKGVYLVRVRAGNTWSHHRVVKL